MPIYEYLCKKCGRQFERIQKFSDEPLKKCEQCGGALERLLSSPAIQFKGSGWYVTDYARKSTGDSTKSEGGSDSGSKTKPAESSGTKSSEKKETTTTKKTS